MTRAWRRFVSFVAAMPMAMSGIAVASVPDARSPADTAWAQTVEQNSLEAFAHFAMTYPESPYAELAYAKLSNPDSASVPTTLPSAPSDQNAASEPGLVPSAFMVV